MPPLRPSVLCNIIYIMVFSLPNLYHFFYHANIKFDFVKTGGAKGTADRVMLFRLLCAIIRILVTPSACAYERALACVVVYVFVCMCVCAQAQGQACPIIVKLTLI